MTHTRPAPERGPRRAVGRRAWFAMGTAVLGIAEATAIAGAASAQPGAAQVTTGMHAVVTIRNVAFHPGSVTIRRGGTVTWHFADPQVSHNVTSRGRTRFRSSPTKLTGTYTVHFTRPGVYRYACTIHPNMLGTVTVR